MRTTVPVNKMKQNQTLLNENENVRRASFLMLIPCLTCNDITPQTLRTNVVSAVITGLSMQDKGDSGQRGAGEPFP